MEQLNSIVALAKTRDLDAWRLLVEATQTMAYAVALGVLHDSNMAQDAAQEAYLRAFRGIV
jgi:RNA polymerase sigma-70 factor (ECF subfamily)